MYYGSIDAFLCGTILHSICPECKMYRKSGLTIENTNIPQAFSQTLILEPAEIGYFGTSVCEGLGPFIRGLRISRRSQCRCIFSTANRRRLAVRFEIIAGFGFISVPTGAHFWMEICTFYIWGYVPVTTETHFGVTVCLIKYLFTAQTGAKF